jgi:hypothetical protein
MTTKKFVFPTMRARYTIRVEVTLKDDTVAVGVEEGPVLSITGGLWDGLRRDYDYCGQCLDGLMNEPFKNPDDKKLFKKIHRLWRAHHLNNLNAGTAKQTAAIKEWEAQGNKYNYAAVCEYLKSINLYEDDEIDTEKGRTKKCKYGHVWLYRPIPKKDLQEIRELIK